MIFILREKKILKKKKVVPGYNFWNYEDKKQKEEYINLLHGWFPGS